MRDMDKVSYGGIAIELNTQGQSKIRENTAQEPENPGYNDLGLHWSCPDIQQVQILSAY